MNNAVYVGSECIGYRCFTCGDIFQSMWGTTCNRCRHQDDENAKLRKEIRDLKEAIQKVKGK